jgi:serine acetyltransferase
VYLQEDLSVVGPVVEIAPALSVVFGEGIVVGGGAGLGIGREAVAGDQPLLVQGVELVESSAQDAELIQPSGLYQRERNVAQSSFGGF